MGSSIGENSRKAGINNAKAGINSRKAGINSRKEGINSRKEGINSRKVGTYYEQAVGYYLEQQGYLIVEYNYRCHKGEIDIIAQDGEYLVFCEVKYRQNGKKGSPLEAVGKKKQKTLYQCALYYLCTNRMNGCPCRFDVIGVEGGKIIHIKNAFCG